VPPLQSRQNIQWGLQGAAQIILKWSLTGSKLMNASKTGTWQTHAYLSCFKHIQAPDPSVISSTHIQSIMFLNPYSKFGSLDHQTVTKLAILSDRGGPEASHFASHFLPLPSLLPSFCFKQLFRSIAAPPKSSKYPIGAPRSSPNHIKMKPHGLQTNECKQNRNLTKTCVFIMFQAHPSSGSWRDFQYPHTINYVFESIQQVR